MTTINSSGDEWTRRELLWRVFLWFAIAMLLSFACAYVDAWMRKDLPSIFHVFVPSGLLSAGTAWALGLFSERTSREGKRLVVFGSLITPVVFFLIAIAAIVADWESQIQLPPPIAADQQGIQLDDASWTKVLERRFPVGTNEKVLTDELRNQGFHIDAHKREATFSYQNGVCGVDLWIGWGVKPDGRIANIKGMAAGYRCL